MATLDKVVSEAVDPDNELVTADAEVVLPSGISAVIVPDDEVVTASVISDDAEVVLPSGISEAKVVIDSVVPDDEVVVVSENNDEVVSSSGVSEAEVVTESGSGFTACSCLKSYGKVIKLQFFFLHLHKATKWFHILPFSKSYVVILSYHPVLSLQKS